MKVQKVNATVDALVVKYADSVAAPTIYLDDKYEMLQDGYTLDEIAERTADYLRAIKSAEPVIPIITPDYMKQNLYCALINADENKELLKVTPHERVEDLAVIPRCKVGADGSFIVKNDVCQYVRMTSEEVMEQAHKNTDKQEFTCQSMAEVLRKMLRVEGMPDEYIDEIINTQDVDSKMYVLTNAEALDGAAALTSKKALEEAYNKIGEDYYILPSSRHEVILLPQKEFVDVEVLKDMVQSVNTNEVRPEDKLSDHVYKYDSQTKKLSIADGPKKTEDEAQVKEETKTHTRSH